MCNAVAFRLRAGGGIFSHIPHEKIPPHPTVGLCGKKSHMEAKKPQNPTSKHVLLKAKYVENYTFWNPTQTGPQNGTYNDNLEAFLQTKTGFQTKK